MLAPKSGDFGERGDFGEGRRDFGEPIFREREIVLYSYVFHC
jgi:hypothetical protein